MEPSSGLVRLLAMARQRVATARRLDTVDGAWPYQSAPGLSLVDAPGRLEGGSFEEFYRQHGDTVRRAVALALGDADLGAEATDEALTRACERWAELEASGNPGGWVYRVAINWARSHQRRYRFRDRRPVPERAWLPVPGDPDLADALSRLSDDHRAAVVCRYYLDWSVEETALALDVPAGTVKSRLARALENLKQRLEDR